MPKNCVTQIAQITQINYMARGYELCSLMPLGVRKRGKVISGGSGGDGYTWRKAEGM